MAFGGGSMVFRAPSGVNSHTGNTRVGVCEGEKGEKRGMRKKPAREASRTSKLKSRR